MSKVLAVCCSELFSHYLQFSREKSVSSVLRYSWTVWRHLWRISACTSHQKFFMRSEAISASSALYKTPEGTYRRNVLSTFQKAARCWGATWDWRKQMELLHDTRQRPNSGSFQLLVWSLKLSSCDLRPPSASALWLNKVSVQTVVFTLLSVQVGGDDLWRVRVMLGVLKCELVRKWWVVNRYHVTTNYYFILFYSCTGLLCRET